MKIDKWFAAALFIVIGTALINGGKFFTSVAIAVVLILVFEIIFLFICKKTINIKDRTTTFKITCGEEITIKYEVENIFRIFIPYVSINSSILKKKKDEIVYSTMLPKKKNIVEEKLSFNYRGIYNIGSKVISIKGIWGIVTMTYLKKNEEVIIVTPKIYKFEHRFFGAIGNSDLAVGGTKGESSNIKEIRKYRAGDNLKRINWKCSAKFSKLMVNEYEDKIGETNYILIDMNAINFELDPSKQKEEYLVDFTASFCKNIANIGLRFNVFISNKEIEQFVVDDEESFLLLEDYFVRNESDGRRDIIDVIKQEFGNISDGIGLIIVINKLSKNLLKEINRSFNYSKNNLIIVFNDCDEAIQSEVENNKNLQLVKLEESIRQNGV